MAGTEELGSLVPECWERGQVDLSQDVEGRCKVTCGQRGGGVARRRRALAGGSSLCLCLLFPILSSVLEGLMLCARLSASALLLSSPSEVVSQRTDMKL